MKKKILALCDREAEYAQQMTDYLKTKEELPFEVYTYTEPEKLVEFGSRQEIEMLIVSESAYTYEVSRMQAGQILMLNENNGVRYENVLQVDKYQQAENVYRFIMNAYLEHMPNAQNSVQTDTNVKMIGLYSPVKRCLQTSFALTLGQVLARQYRTLYLSFEHYAGWNGLLKKEGGKDLSDLLCYLHEEGDKFKYRLRMVEQRIGALCYIPPFYAGQNLIYITASQWMKLLGKIRQEGGYTYVILDLSESMQGLFEVLRMCDRIYTIVREDEPARCKIEQYEHLLRMYEFEDVLDKTSRQALPVFRNLPGQMEQFTKGELAAFVRNLIREDLETKW